MGAGSPGRRAASAGIRRGRTAAAPRPGGWSPGGVLAMKTIGTPRVSGSRRSSSARPNPSPSESRVPRTTASGFRTAMLRRAHDASVSAASSYPASRSAAPMRCCRLGVFFDDEDVAGHRVPAVYPAGPDGQRLGSLLSTSSLEPKPMPARAKKNPKGRRVRSAAGWRRSCSPRGRGRGCAPRARRCCTRSSAGRSAPIRSSSARALGADPVVAVLGHQRAAVEAALGARFGAGRGDRRRADRAARHRPRGQAGDAGLEGVRRRPGAGALRRRAAPAAGDAGGAGGDRAPLSLPGGGDGDAARSDRLRPDPARRAGTRHRRRRGEGRLGRGARHHRGERRHLLRPGRFFPRGDRRVCRRATRSGSTT